MRTNLIGVELFLQLRTLRGHTLRNARIHKSSVLLVTGINGVSISFLSFVDGNHVMFDRYVHRISDAVSFLDQPCSLFSGALGFAPVDDNISHSSSGNNKCEYNHPIKGTYVSVEPFHLFGYLSCRGGEAAVGGRRASPFPAASARNCAKPGVGDNHPSLFIISKHSRLL
jgi:hypothetical protein